MPMGFVPAKAYLGPFAQSLAGSDFCGFSAWHLIPGRPWQIKKPDTYKTGAKPELIRLALRPTVQKMGVEPTRYCYHTDLNRARLPIPPLLRLREMGLEPTRAYTHKILSLACLPIPALPRTNNSISHKFHLINHFLQIFLNYFFHSPLDI